MRRRHAEIDRWLAAEAAGDEARAETAFVAALARLPRLAPLPGFADRVLRATPMGAQARLKRAPVAGAATLVEGWRWAVAAALGITGVAVSLLPALRWLPVESPRLSGVLKTGALAAAAVGEWLQGGLAVWAFLLQFGRWVAVAVQTPEIAASLAGSAVVGAAGLYMLNHLLAPERRSWR